MFDYFDFSIIACAICPGLARVCMYYTLAGCSLVNMVIAPSTINPGSTSLPPFARSPPTSRLEITSTLHATRQHPATPTELPKKRLKENGRLGLGQLLRDEHLHAA